MPTLTSHVAAVSLGATSVASTPISWRTYRIFLAQCAYHALPLQYHLDPGPTFFFIIISSRSVASRNAFTSCMRHFFAARVLQEVAHKRIRGDRPKHHVAQAKGPKQDVAGWERLGAAREICQNISLCKQSNRKKTFGRVTIWLGHGPPGGSPRKVASQRLTFPRAPEKRDFLLFPVGRPRPEPSPKPSPCRLPFLYEKEQIWGAGFWGRKLWETDFYPVLVPGRFALSLWGCRAPAQYWIKIVHPWVQRFYPALRLGSWGRLLGGFPLPGTVLKITEKLLKNYYKCNFLVIFR